MLHAGKPGGKRRSRLPPQARRALSLALLVTTLLAAAFGGDDFFLASPGQSAGSGAQLRPGAAASHDKRPDSAMAAAHSLPGTGASTGVRRRSAAGCWRGVSSGVVVIRQQSIRAAGILRGSAREVKGQLVRARAAWPGQRRVAHAEVSAVSKRLGAAGARLGHAVRRDWRTVVAAVQAAAAAAYAEALRLHTEPSARLASCGRCATASRRSKCMCFREFGYSRS